MKRALSLVLVFIMILTLIPAVYAADTVIELPVNGLTVTAGETFDWDFEGEEFYFGEDADGKIVWQTSGTQIIAGLTPGGFYQTGAELTFTNKLGVDATLRFEYTITRAGDIDAKVLDSYGSIVASPFEKKLVKDESYTITVYSHNPYYSGDGTTTLTISNISLSTGSEEAKVTFAAAENGSYTVGDVQITGETSYTVAPGTKYSVSAAPAEGYQFFGWYNGSEYISHTAEYEVTVSADVTIQPVFIPNDAPVFGVGLKRFQDLNDANAYAESSPVKTIVVMNDAVISGNYTISEGNTLLIPYDDAASVHTQATSIAVQTGDSTWENRAWEEPRAYRTLTMAPGSTLTVYGSLNVGGRHSAGPFLTAGSPSGDLGMINMGSGSNITVASGATLYCWGYIYGSGTVTVKNGGSVHENFQFTDFRGGNYTLGLATEMLVFPLSQYYVQNVEVAATFEYGASEYVWGTIYLQSKVLGAAVQFIGNDEHAMFKPGAGGTVTKKYDPTTDRLVLDVNGDGAINPMGVSLGGESINTQTFVLPINSNMTININSGTTSLNQSLALLPGAKLNIAQGAVLSLKSAEPLKDDSGNPVHYTGSNNLIIYDRDQWLNAYKPKFNNGYLVGADPIEAKFVYTSPGGLKRMQPVAYSPSRAYTRTEADLVDAVVDINGRLITDGYIYTTVDVDLYEYFYKNNLAITGGGASVISSKGTGVLAMNNGAGYDFITLQPTQTSDSVEYAYIPMVSARLQNADGSYVDTIGSADGASYEYCAACGEWYLTGTHKVEITWIVDGVPSTQEVCLGKKPVYGIGNDPVKEGYEFIGWSTANDNEPEFTATADLPEVTREVTYWACFKEETQAMLGDFDLDGDVDASDLTLLARHVGKIEVLTGQALENADVNGDKTVDSYDLTKHARYVGKIITDWNQN